MKNTRKKLLTDTKILSKLEGVEPSIMIELFKRGKSQQELNLVLESIKCVIDQPFTEKDLKKIKSILDDKGFRLRGLNRIGC